MDTPMSRPHGGRLVVLVALTGVALLVALSMSSVASAGGGNSANAKLCQKNGWINLVRTDGSTFAGDGDCVSYGAQGGTLLPKPTCFAGSENFAADADHSTPSTFSGGTIDTAFGTGSELGGTRVVGTDWLSGSLASDSHVLFTGGFPGVNSFQLSFDHAVGSVELQAQPNNSYNSVTLTAFDSSDAIVGTDTATPTVTFEAVPLTVDAGSMSITHFTVSAASTANGFGFTNIVWGCN